MNEPELLPIMSGLLLGCVLGLVHPGARLKLGIPLAIVFGMVATVASGEFLVSWAFLLVDVPLVAASAAVGLLATHYVRWARQPG